MTNRTVVILALATLTALLSTVLTTTSRAQDPERTVNLSPGCNMVTLTFADGTDPATLASAVTPGGALQTVWRLDNATGTFQAYVPQAPQASDLTSLNLLDAVYICVDAAATVSVPSVTPDPSGATASWSLSRGCNTVGLTFPDGTDPSILTTAVSPAGALQAVWRLDNATGSFEAYVAAVPQASDLTSLQFLDAVHLCVATPGSLTMPWLAGMPPPPTRRGSDVPENLFDNGSFERGAAPWFSLTTPAWGTPFRVSQDAAHTGQRSALLEMRGAEDAGSKVFGVVQEVQPEQFPELISGYYRLGEWTRGTDIQYLQFVVIVLEAENSPITQAPNYQIRYPLAGIADPPFAITNAKFVFVGTEEPVADDWVYFESNVRQDFIDQWGAVPEGFSNIRVLFEVRYDGKQEGETEVSADVFYDDLYLGPAEANPNGPEEASPP